VPDGVEDVRGATKAIRDQAAKLAREGQRIALQVQREVAMATDDIKRSTKDGKRVVVQYDGRHRARTLLLPGDTLSADERNHLNEDLTVMHRIVSKATGRRREGEPFRIAFERPDAPELDALYLEGYGALILVAVDFPLVEPEKPAAKKAEDEGKDQVWEETRRRVKGNAGGPEDPDEAMDGLGGAASGSGSFGGGGGATVVQDVVMWTRETEAFDKDRVEALKKKLTASLKHASNIRGLRPEDTVTVVVTGAPTSNGPVVRKFHGGVDPMMLSRYGVAATVTDSGDSGTSRMVLRAKKSDIDAFAAGKVDLEKFPVKVTIGR
jgi:hypothetical protein